MRNEEVMPLQTLYDRGKQNKVEGLSLVAGKDIKQIEPHCKVRLSRFFFFFFFTEAVDNFMIGVCLKGKDIRHFSTVLFY